MMWGNTACYLASPDVGDHEVLDEVPGEEVDRAQTSHRHLNCLQGAEAGVSTRNNFNQSQRQNKNIEIRRGKFKLIEFSIQWGDGHLSRNELSHKKG